MRRVQSNHEAPWEPYTVNIRKAEKLVLSAWEESKQYFFHNNPSECVHSWEQADEASLRDLNEHFQGGFYRYAKRTMKQNHWNQPPNI